MPELYWSGQGDIDVFADTQRNIEYWPSERPREVPEEAVEWYLSFDGWSTEPPEAATEAEAETAQMDADEFIDAHWQTVTAAIRNGEADDRLAAIEAAEYDRENDARDSVLSAIAERRATIDADGATESEQ